MCAHVYKNHNNAFSRNIYLDVFSLFYCHVFCTLGPEDIKEKDMLLLFDYIALYRSPLYVSNSIMRYDYYSYCKTILIRQPPGIFTVNNEVAVPFVLLDVLHPCNGSD